MNYCHWYSLVRIKKICISPAPWFWSSKSLYVLCAAMMFYDRWRSPGSVYLLLSVHYYHKSMWAFVASIYRELCMFHFCISATLLILHLGGWLKQSVPTTSSLFRRPIKQTRKKLLSPASVQRLCSQFQKQ